LIVVASAPSVVASVSHQSLPEQPGSLSNFELPWTELPASLVASLNSKSRIAPKDRREVVRVFINSIRKFCPNPRKSDLAVVAKQMADMYPESFMDRIGTDVIAGGHNDLLNRLCERRDNVCRASHALKRKQSNPEEQRKRKPKDSYGCVSWQPQLPDNIEGIEQEKEALKGIFHRGSEENVEYEKQIAEGMKNTYGLQRQMINSRATVAELREEFPFLFQKEGLLRHFQELIGHDAYANVVVAFQTKCSTLWAFLKSVLPGSAFDELDEAVANERQRAMLPGIVFVVMSYFKESPDDLFHVVEV